MYSLLDMIFDPLGCGAGPKSVIRLSEEMRSELLALALLAPLSVVNLRAQYADFISATDASSTAMGAVRASLPPKISCEIARHSLRKGTWTKLLPAEKAWLREHQLLPEDEELPDSAYRTHPLWELLARGLDYSETWRRPVRKRLHINVHELRAHLH